MVYIKKMVLFSLFIYMRVFVFCCCYCRWSFCHHYCCLSRLKCFELEILHVFLIIALSTKNPIFLPFNLPYHLLLVARVRNREKNQETRKRLLHATKAFIYVEYELWAWSMRIVIHDEKETICCTILHRSINSSNW